MIDPSLPEHHAFEVGCRLRRIREAHGLSQRELARRADMTNGSLSMIEQGKVSPSVHSLERILRAIPLSLAEFFQAVFDESSPILKREQALRITRQAYTLELYDLTRFGAGQVFTARQVLAPGADCSVDWLAGTPVVWGLIIVGEIELTLGEASYCLTAGDGFHFSCARPHRFFNRSAGPAEWFINAKPASTRRQNADS